MKVLLMVSLCYIATSLCAMVPVSHHHQNKYHHLTVPIAHHFKDTNIPVVFWLDSPVYVTNQSTQLDALHAIVLTHSDWMVAVFRSSLRCMRCRTRLQNVFIAATVRSLQTLLASLEYDCFYPTGRYIFIVTEQLALEATDVVTFESKPFVMVRTVGNETRYSGLEVKIFNHIAAKLNVSIVYTSPPNNTRWGILLPHNSTGQMGMLQRNEADVGFGSVGRSIERDHYLRSSVPSIVSQLSMTIPPRLPYTALEKLFLPLRLSAWLLVAAGYTTILCLYVVLFRGKHRPRRERIPGLYYTFWTILMGGPGREVHRHSTRLYVVSLVLNALIVRNLYQSALFQRLKSNDLMAANLHTYQDINEAGLSYYMFTTTVRFYADNPEVNGSIRAFANENIDWDEVMYNISQHRLKGVIPLSLESIAYYVKHRGQQQKGAMVYVSEHTAISYYVAFHFPRRTALQQPFDRLLHRLQAGGFILHWRAEYRNNPNGAKNYEQQDGVVPTPLQLQQVAGGFYLWALGLLVASVAFVGEIAVSKRCYCSAGKLIPLVDAARATEHLQAPLKHHFQYPTFPVNFRAESSENGTTTTRELFEINDLMRENSGWLIGTVSGRLPIVTNPYASFYNVFFADGYDAMGKILQTLNYTDYDPTGRCLLVINAAYETDHMVQLVAILWQLRMVNVALIVQEAATDADSYRAYSYDPYREGKCELLEPLLLDQFVAGGWQSLHRWYRDKMENFHGCSLSVGTFAAKPYSMVRRDGNATIRYGMEVSIVENVARWFNFTIDYHSPAGTVKWGIIRAANSTGMMGMIQRNEVAFGFGCMGYNEYRNRYLTVGLPSFITQLSMAAPPARPFTWLEKLFAPFTLEAWLCIALCYAGYLMLTVLVFDSRLVTTVEHFRNPAYNVWVMLMGGPSRPVRQTSIRLFLAGFVLNALVIRTMYHSAMFELLQATTTLGSDLNTFQQINAAHMLYYMYITTSFYYKDNPLVRGRIRILWDETKDWDELMYDISHYRLNGVFVIPLDAIEYYVKNVGQRGLVYVSSHTSINYNPGFVYPKASPLTEPFSALIGRYQAAGLVPIWREQFRDTRYWNNVKQHPEPISLRWSHLSGGFYLWACLLVLSSLVLASLLTPIVQTHYRVPEGFVAVRVQNGGHSNPSHQQKDLIDGLMRTGHDWLAVSFDDLPAAKRRPAYYGVFLVADYRSLCTLLDGMTPGAYQFDGLYTIVIEQRRPKLHDVMERLWSCRLLNVVVIVSEKRANEDEERYVAYTYHPYREHRCGSVEPYAVGQYANGTWTELVRWFAKRTDNFNGCPLVIGTIHIIPCSIIERDGPGGSTTHKGIEVSQVDDLSRRFNFTPQYRISNGSTRWGFARAVNSTGLMGWIQRGEVDFGLGSIGISLSRVQHLRPGIASRFGQLAMAIPPKRPDSSVEKLIKPFSRQTWLCVVLGLAGISTLAWALFGIGWRRVADRLRHPCYTVWVLTMGGPCGALRMDSTRLFVVSLVLNMLVVRTLYHAAMFERLQASASLASELDTLEQINRAGKMYIMHKTITLFFNDNPLVGPRRIRRTLHDNENWEELLYQLSRPGSDFVVTLPLDCIKYYVQQYGNRGLVYVGKHNGITYNTAFFYPQTTALQAPFSARVLAYHSAGLVDHWAQPFEDGRYWSNAKADPEPTSLAWSHLSGAFYLCGTMHLLAVCVFVAELGWARKWRKASE
uniref:Ionotropic glutamate receptor L-glutamate and glycine-binding domain-containing protein n=1 Tax=Anopheles melas TaxID=34690 RepID=A0A182TZ66_9DIPT